MKIYILEYYHFTWFNIVDVNMYNTNLFDRVRYYTGCFVKSFVSARVTHEVTFYYTTNN